MMKNLLYIHRISLALIVTLGFMFSCEEDHEPATVTFYPTLNGESTEPAVNATGSPVTIALKTSRRMLEDSRVNIRIEGNGAGYGKSYTTSPPQLEPGIVTVTIPKGEVGATFDFIPKNDEDFVPTGYQYTLSIDQTSNEIRSIGQKRFKIEVEDNTQAFFSEDFNDCPGTKFVEEVVTGVSTWGCSNFGYPNESTSTREANAFGKGSASPSTTYLIMDQPVNGADYSLLYVSALVYSRFTGNGGIKFVYSENYPGTGNPEGFLDEEETIPIVWKELTELNALLPAAGTQVWKPVAQYIRDFPAADIYIAIRHEGGITTSSSSWRIENFEIKGN